MEKKQTSVFNLSTFFCLYIAQTLPSSFIFTALAVLMRQGHYSLTTISLLSLVKLPWILKFLWAPLVDRACVTMSDFKRCIIGSELIYAVALLAAGLLDVGTQMPFIIILVCLALMASATQDIATDAIAVLTTKRQNRSLVNSMQSMGSFFGSLIGSGLLLIVMKEYGWRAVLVCLAMFVIIALMPLVFNRKLEIDKQASDRHKVSWLDFAKFFASKQAVKQTLFLLFFGSGIVGLVSVVKSYLVDLGYGMAEIGMMVGIVGKICACIMAFLAGLIVKRIGIYRARRIFAVLMLVPGLYFLFLTRIQPTTASLYIGICLLWGCYAMAMNVIYVTAMDFVREAREGTDFTVQIEVTHLGAMLTTMLSGVIGDAFGFSGIYIMGIVFALISIVLVLLFFKNQSHGTKDN